MPSLYTIRALDPDSERELSTITCFSQMTIWESRPELRVDPRDLPGYGWPETLQRYRVGCRSPDQRYLVAVDPDGNLVGTSIVVIRTDLRNARFGYFWSRYVLPAHRRHGLARQFLGDSMSWFRSRGAGYAEVHIHVENKALRSLFEKRGFKVVDRGNDTRWSWLVMRADL